jgi:TonB-linked SusC/RagA family outer membrane protein
MTILVRLLLLLLLLQPAFAPRVAEARASVQLAPGAQHYAPITWYTSSQDPAAYAIVQRRVTINASDISLSEVLRRLERQGRVRFVHSAGAVVNDHRVSLARVNAPLLEVLSEVLEGSGLEAWSSPGGQIVLRSVAQDADLERRERDVRGRVTDGDTGETIPGVNVVVRQTTIGTVTDINGRYTLTIPDDAQVLVFSFVGYETQEVAIAGRTEINVAMRPSIAQLDEMVVVGYGTVQRRRVTGSVASIQMRDIADLPAPSFENAILGRMPGVQVQETSGEPGSAPNIRIRGTRSITAGNDPLYVIDGFPVSRNTGVQGGFSRNTPLEQPPPVNPLAALNPGDIQSIEILKDASAAAIYGSRGANGVVLVTTNRGRRDGRTSVTYSVQAGMQELARRASLMNAAEIIDLAIDARNNTFVAKYGVAPPNARTNDGRVDLIRQIRNNANLNDDNIMIPESYVNWDGTDTDWQAEMFSRAPSVTTSLGVSGGSQNVGYYVAGSFTTQEGIVGNSGLDRYSVRTNLEIDPARAVRVGVNAYMAYTRYNRLPVSGTYFAATPGIVYSGLVHSPVVKPRNGDGTPNQLNNHSHLGGATTTTSNPLGIIDGFEDRLNAFKTLGTIYADITLAPGLVYRANAGVDIDNYSRQFYRNSSFLYRNQTVGQPLAEANNSYVMNWLAESTLSYNVNVNDVHFISAVAGGALQREDIEMRQIVADAFPDDNIRTVNGGRILSADGRAEAWALASTFARVNYSLYDKYLFTGSIRADRSSRFGRNNQTGIFPSVSVGWRVSEEPFLQDVAFLSNLSVRTSYGVSGNFQIPNYAAIGRLDQSAYVFGNARRLGQSPFTIPNPDLTWETTRQVNAGLDVSLWGDRVFFTTEFYNSITEDLLLNVEIPSALGYSVALMNIGRVRNRGVEFGLTSRNVDNRRLDFSWQTDFNLSTNQNRVLALGPDNAPIVSLNVAGWRYITAVGHPIGSFYGWKVGGIYQNAQEIAQRPRDTQAPKPAPGDFWYEDVNGDGVINADDRTILGSYFPDYTFGITNRFSFRGADMSFLIQGVQGAQVLNLTHRHLGNGEANFNSYTHFNDRWRSPENPGNGKVPRADRQTELHGNNNRPSDHQIEDASYIRLRDVTIGYTFGRTLLGNRINRARVHFTATNVATWSDYLGFNPEVSLRPESATTPGLDYGAYPLSRSYTLGLSLSL